MNTKKTVVIAIVLGALALGATNALAGASDRPRQPHGPGEVGDDRRVHPEQLPKKIPLLGRNGETVGYGDRDEMLRPPPLVGLPPLQQPQLQEPGPPVMTDGRPATGRTFDPSELPTK